MYSTVTVPHLFYIVPAVVSILLHIFYWVFSFYWKDFICFLSAPVNGAFTRFHADVLVRVSWTRGCRCSGDQALIMVPRDVESDQVKQTGEQQGTDLCFCAWFGFGLNVIASHRCGEESCDAPDALMNQSFLWSLPLLFSAFILEGGGGNVRARPCRCLLPFEGVVCAALRCGFSLADKVETFLSVRLWHENGVKPPTERETFR